MITSTICAALDTFQQAANRGTAVYLSLELVRELREALNAEPEGATMAEDALVALDRIQRGDVSHGSDDFDLVANALGQLRRWGTPATPPALPPNFIDSEHAGQGRRVLETFYQAERAEGGTADEIHLRGLKAVLAARPAIPAIPATPPAPGPGEVAELVELLKLAGRWATSTGVQLDRFAALFDQQQPELATLRGVPKPEEVAAFFERLRDAVCTAVAEALGGAYDCQRVWEAWNVGTMGPDDFTLTAEDDDRVAEIADAAIEAFLTFQAPAPQAGEVQPPRLTYLDAIRLAQGCHDYSGGHSGPLGEAFQDGVGTVVAVLKQAAVGPWDSQTMAVFGVGSAPQVGEGEA